MLCAVGLAAASCGRVERAKECQALAVVVNSAIDAIEPVHRSEGESHAALQEIAGRYEGLAAEVGRVSLSQPELRAMVVEYVEVLGSCAQSLRGIAAARQGRDLSREVRLRTELDTVVRRERVIVKRIEQACHQP